jgi:hypothetical protein
MIKTPNFIMIYGNDKFLLNGEALQFLLFFRHVEIADICSNFVGRASTHGCVTLPRDRRTAFLQRRPDRSAVGMGIVATRGSAMAIVMTRGARMVTAIVGT